MNLGGGYEASEIEKVPELEPLIALLTRETVKKGSNFSIRQIRYEYFVSFSRIPDSGHLFR